MTYTVSSGTLNSTIQYNTVFYTPLVFMSSNLVDVMISRHPHVVVILGPEGQGRRA